MPQFLGRSIVLTWGGASFAGVREKSVALAGEPIDISNDDSSGWREILSEAGEDTVTLSISGVTINNALKVDWFAKTRTKAVTITYPDGGVIAGDFFLATYSETGPYKEGTTFEVELQSTGEVTYT